MNKAIVTYGKREFKKVLLLPIVSVIYVIGVFVTQYFTIENELLTHYLAHGFSGYYDMDSLGDVYMKYLCDNILNDVHWIFTVLFVAFLIQRLFYLENSGDVSDFLRLLPIQERTKVFVKLLIGEGLILFLSTVFGIVGTISFQHANSYLQLRNQMVANMAPENGVLMIWQLALMMFVTMSAMFMVFYLAQSCIHHRALAFAAGIGVLGMPLLIATVVCDLFGVDTSLMSAACAITNMLPLTDTIRMIESGHTYIGVYGTYWDGYLTTIILWGSMTVIAAALIVLSVKMRWNVKESSNRLINSRCVRSFLISGIVFAVAMIVAMIVSSGVDYTVWTEEVQRESCRVYAQSLIIVFLVGYGVVQMVLYLIERRHKRIDKEMKI